MSSVGFFAIYDGTLPRTPCQSHKKPEQRQIHRRVCAHACEHACTGNINPPVRFPSSRRMHMQLWYQNGRRSRWAQHSRSCGRHAAQVRLKVPSQTVAPSQAHGQMHTSRACAMAVAYLALIADLVHSIHFAFFYRSFRTAACLR